MIDTFSGYAERMEIVDKSAGRGSHKTILWAPVYPAPSQLQGCTLCANMVGLHVNWNEPESVSTRSYGTLSLLKERIHEDSKQLSPFHSSPRAKGIPEPFT